MKRNVSCRFCLFFKHFGGDVNLRKTGIFPGSLPLFYHFPPPGFPRTMAHPARARRGAALPGLPAAGEHPGHPPRLPDWPSAAAGSGPRPRRRRGAGGAPGSTPSPPASSPRPGSPGRVPRLPGRLLPEYVRQVPRRTPRRGGRGGERGRAPGEQQGGLPQRLPPFLIHGWLFLRAPEAGSVRGRNAPAALSGRTAEKEINPGCQPRAGRENRRLPRGYIPKVLFSG